MPSSMALRYPARCASPWKGGDPGISPPNTTPWTEAAWTKHCRSLCATLKRSTDKDKDKGEDEDEDEDVLVLVLEASDPILAAAAASAWFLAASRTVPYVQNRSCSILG